MIQYQDYSSDRRYMSVDRAYYAKHKGRMRDSDRRILELVEQSAIEPKSIIDLGCGHGGLLKHLRARFPSARICGTDLSSEALATARADAGIIDVELFESDILNLPADRFDVAVTSATGMFFSPAEYVTMACSVARIVKPGGVFVSWDYVTPYDQQIAIVEISEFHPTGLPLYVRSEKIAREAFLNAGFTSVTFHPFEMSIDLEAPDGSTISRTVKTETGERICMRGALFQPWCHLIAIKG